MKRKSQGYHGLYETLPLIVCDCKVLQFSLSVIVYTAVDLHGR